MLGVPACLAKDHFRHAYVQQAQALDRISLTQYRGAAKRMQPTAVDVPGLALAVEQASIGGHHALHTTLTPAPAIGLFDPLALLAPEIIESFFGLYMTACYALNCHPVTSCAIHILATWRRAV
ncbi:hypothetical protein ES708_34684 [subsurface metagenome]